MTAMGSDSVKWVVNVVLSRRSEGRVAHAQSLYASGADGDGTVVCQWQSDTVIAIVRACAPGRPRTLSPPRPPPPVVPRTASAQVSVTGLMAPPQPPAAA
jgi:hypothetical protein